MSSPTSTIRLYDPTDEVEAPHKGLAPRVDTLKGKVIGLLDISKAGGDLVLDRVEQRLCEEVGDLTIIRMRKPHFSRPAPQEVIDALVDQCQAVVSAMAD